MKLLQLLQHERKKEKLSLEYKNNEQITLKSLRNKYSELLSRIYQMLQKEGYYHHFLKFEAYEKPGLFRKLLGKSRFRLDWNSTRPCLERMDRENKSEYFINISTNDKEDLKTGIFVLQQLVT